MSLRSTLLTFVLIMHCFCGHFPAQGQAVAIENEPKSAIDRVVLVTIDGLRPQEYFGGADERLIAKEAGVRDVAALREKFYRQDSRERRACLLPFIGATIESTGMVFGDAEQGSVATVLNPHRFSYPGYSEILTGWVDPRIDSNDKRPNPNVTVLEWLHRMEPFRGRVFAFCSWDVFPFIINDLRSEIPVNAGWAPISDPLSSARTEQLDQWSQEVPRYWDNVRYDYFTYSAALECVRNQQPKLLYVAFGETDDWAHAGRYDLYLDAARRTDRYIESLWQEISRLPEYAGRTALVITTDHGRGDTREEWKSHGASIPGSEFIWIAILAPGIADKLPHRGHVHQAQVAATVAALLGYDYQQFQPDCSPPLPLRNDQP